MAYGQHRLVVEPLFSGQGCGWFSSKNTANEQNNLHRG